MPSPPKKRKNSQSKGIFRDIFIAANPEMAPFGLVFVYPPENFDQRPLGTIFGIIKIFDTSPESSFIANLLASVIKKEYFSKPGRPAYDSFEASLRKANLALAELARQGSVKWIGKICFAGGVLEKNNLHFSKLGTTAILLLRGGMLADIGSSLESETAEADTHPLKTFSDISSGKVEIGDRLIFTTADLLEIFSLEEIRQNAARFSREEFPDIISASLTANSELSGTIVVNITPEEEAETRIEKIPVSAPINYPPQRLNRPQDFPPVRQPQIPLPAPLPAKSENSIYMSESDEILPKASIGEKILFFIHWSLLGTKKGVLAIWAQARRFFGQINWQKIFLSIKSLFLYIVQIFKKIDFRKKNTRIIAAAGVIVVLAAVAFSVFKNAGNINPSSQSSPPAPNPSPESAPTDTPSDTNAKNIENISQVAALPADSRELLFMNGAIFSLSAEKSILKIDPASGGTEKFDSDVQSGKLLLASAMPDLNTIFILTADKKVISFTPVNKKFQENGISFPGSLNATDIKTYLTYIYVLDSNANQVYRYPRAEGGFGDRQDWLKAGADVKNSTSFAINEDVFATSRNQITAYLQGKKDEKINFENPNIALAIDKIYTAPGLENIYVLDNKNHRVIQYSKDGKIAVQYFNKSIAVIKDFTVDEKNKIVYLQKTDSISKFSME